MIDLSNLLQNSINNIWDEFNEFNSIPPLSVSSVPKNGVIFIGINPALNENDRKELIKRENKNIDFYDLPSNRTEEKVYRYFNKFYEIQDHINLPVGHIDLLYIRETQQKAVEALIKDKRGIQFVFDQLQITRRVIDEIIEKASPKVFIVNNTLARGLLGRYKHYDENYYPLVKDDNLHWINYFFEWDDDIGTYILPTKNGNIPFFFTSMLTGQRALDNGSFERLIWHIKKVLS